MARGTWLLNANNSLTLDRPHILAILNVTPDSFSDGGELATVERAVSRAITALEAGASMLDIGGESTRPGAERVDAKEQIARVVPVIRAIRTTGNNVPISVDTTLSEVARVALDAGASAVNDVSGGSEDPQMLKLIAERGCGVILMHRLRPPGEDRYSDQYKGDAPAYEGGVVSAVRGALRSCAQRAIDAGIEPSKVVLDPGLGFGKTVGQNLELIRAASELEQIGYPILSAASRKSFVGTLSGVQEPRDRVVGSVAITLAQYQEGVRLFRVHDVEPHAQALRVAHAIAGEPLYDADRLVSE